MITFYRAPFSTNCERVALALAHKGLEAQSVWIDYSDRGEVERVSGQGLVPVIDDAGHVVTDSMEIVRHLDERHPQAPLYPAEPARSAEMIVFVDWFNRVWKLPPNRIEAELAKPQPDQPAVAELIALMRAYLDLFEHMLDGRSHLMGEDFSAADVAAFPFVKYATLHEPDDDDLFHLILRDAQRDGVERPRLAAWIERVNRRPRA